ncbi:MAG: hypothetical protein ACWGON_03410 [Gemmatimonadota bacterium]
MIGRMEIREVLGMLGTLAALSVAGSAVQIVDAELVEVREKPTVEHPVSNEAPDVSAGVRVAPPVVAPLRDIGEVRLDRPEIVAPPLRCPPLLEGGVRGLLKICGDIFV